MPVCPDRQRGDQKKKGSPNFELRKPAHERSSPKLAQIHITIWKKPDLQNSNCTIRKHNEQAAQSRASISSALLDKRTPSIATKYCRLSPKVGFPLYFWISCIIMHRTDITSGLSRVLFYPKTKKHRWKAISHNLSHSFGLQFSIAYDRLQRPIQARLLASSKKRPNPDATADINQQSNQQ